MSKNFISTGTTPLYGVGPTYIFIVFRLLLLLELGVASPLSSSSLHLSLLFQHFAHAAWYSALRSTPGTCLSWWGVAWQ